MAENNKNNFLKKFKVLNELKEDFLNEIKLLSVFRVNNPNILIVTNDDKVFAFGHNSNGILGFGNDYKINELTINEELSHKQIIDFKYGWCHVTARTIDGKVYCWGYNKNGVLGNGNNDNIIYKPQLNEYLSDKQIIDICCGGSGHTLVLTNSGEVYTWGWISFGQIWNERSGKNEFQLIPIKVNGFNDEKVIQISCGVWHSMALTESGRVFSWGDNGSGQLGLNKKDDIVVNIPSIVLLSNEISIEKISCGPEHSLLLSRDKDIYWFGWNEIEKQITPKKIINENKFIEIESHYDYNISIALSLNGIYYVWGHISSNVKIKEPEETEFKSLDDIFCHYPGITYRTIDFNPKYINIMNNKYEKISMIWEK
jgi:alpha-tubulin suppressor-like RCC1 family protein